ncbi:MAG: glycerol kinase [Gammaproteobacteria bacterium]|nr:MAG: glycerol kinase [Gammaproteobacteria bacterium]
MTADPYLAIDQGTHASRAIVFDGSGNIVSLAQREVALRRIKTGRVEQDPDQILASVRECLLSVLANGPDAGAAALATQRSSIVCWDRDTGKALSPVLSWQDTRAGAYLDKLQDKAEIIRDKTGLLLSPHYGASKLRWCLDHMPAVGAAARADRLCAGPLVSWLLFHLLDGQPFVCDPANAGRTLLLNRHTLDWDDELLRWFGLSRDTLPACTPTLTGYGTLAGTRIPLRIVTGDQPAALYACGEILPETAYINMGTGAFVQRALPDGVKAPAGLLESVVYHDERSTRRMMEATVNGAGAALSWHMKNTGLEGREKQLTAWLIDVSEPPLFLNGVGGLAAPYWQPDFPSEFVGGGNAVEQAAGVAESIVFLLAENLQRMRDAAAKEQQIVVSGGLAQADPLCQKLADLSGVAVSRYPEQEATAKGAAWLLTDRTRSWCEKPGRFEPEENLALKSRYDRWRGAMAQALEPYALE